MLHWAADLFLLRGEVSLGGEASLVDTRLVGASVSMVICPMGSASAALGVSSAVWSPEGLGATDIAVSTVTSSSKDAASTERACSKDMAIIGTAVFWDGVGALR